MHPSGQNKLLAALPEDVYRRLEPALSTVALSLKDVLYEADQAIAHAHFPLSGVMSLVLTMKDGTTVEVGAVGNEGFVGLPVFLGDDTSPMKALCQVPGDVVRMPVDAFRQEISAGDGILRRVVAKYAHALINQVSQSVACNHLHTVEQRLARWLLMTHDRVGKDEFPVTQEFIAQMLGVRRPSVTIAAGLLEKAKLIGYKRGHVTVIDRQGLEAATCECYANVRREYERLLGGNSTTP
jgi:CRP-like cAMP-binding protein